MADYARIKDNVASMLSQGAPESDVSQYLFSEKVTPEQLRNAPSTSEDVIKSTGSGIASGLTGLAGAPGDLSNALAKGSQAASNFIADKFGMDRGPQVGETLLPTGSSIQKGVESLTGKFYEPQTTAGNYAHSIGEAIPGSVLAPGGLIARLASAVGAGAGSEALGQATEGTGWEPYARVAGALGGGVAPYAAGRGLSPITIRPVRQGLIADLENEGVTSLTAGQRSGSKPLQYLESAASSQPMAGGGAERIQTEGQRQFTEAAMRRAGAGPDAVPEVLANNQRRLGNEFETLSARNNLIPDNQMITDITDAVQRYRRIPDSQQARMLQGYIDDIVPHINAGHMPGIEYQPMRSMISADSRSVAQSDPYLSRALRGIRDALDNAMGRSISPADAEAWQTARRQYGAQKTIEKAASRAGEVTGEGQITPANLRNVLPKAGGGYARGEGDLTGLARAGATVMAPLPNSGTAQRLNAFSLLNQATLGAVPALTGRALMSRPVQAYLSNHLPGQAALSHALADDPAGRRALFQALTEASRLKLSNQSR